MVFSDILKLQCFNRVVRNIVAQTAPVSYILCAKVMAKRFSCGASPSLLRAGDVVIVSTISTSFRQEHYPYVLYVTVLPVSEKNPIPECYALVREHSFLHIPQQHNMQTLCALVILLSTDYLQKEDYLPTLTHSIADTEHALLMRLSTSTWRTVQISTNITSLERNFDFTPLDSTNGVHFAILSAFSELPPRVG